MGFGVPETSLMGVGSQSFEKTVQKLTIASANAGILQRKCDRCHEMEKILQRSAFGSAPETVPLIVHEVLRSPGQPLDAQTRALMEPRFRHDFSGVRVHTDAQAAKSAGSVNALAYTVGNDMVFGVGQYTSRSPDGLRLMAHELTHVVQQSGQKGASALEIARPSTLLEKEAKSAENAILHYGEVQSASSAPLQIARQDQTTKAQTPVPGATSAAGSAVPMKRTEFDRIMKERYRVAIIRNGTFEEQKFGDMKKDEWKYWNPGPSSTVYDWIIEAFANFEKTFGGLPPVKDIVFFEVEYRKIDGKATKFPDVGASYSNGMLTIYHGIEKSNLMFNLKGVMESPTSQQAVERNITHELGHGIAETALTQRSDQPPGADPDLFKDYNRTIGWASNGKLYDIQEKAVQDAFKKNTIPPPQFEIRPDNVSMKPWKERPLTSYMADNPADDFAETIMAYVNEPQRLKALSPTRFDFIDKRKSRWLASGQPKTNFWEQVKKGGRARTLQPSRHPTIWERMLIE